MTMRIFVSRDAGAVAVGADEVALEAAAATRGIGIEIVRTGSRGLYWLGPMIEVATAVSHSAPTPTRATAARLRTGAGLDPDVRDAIESLKTA